MVILNRYYHIILPVLLCIFSGCQRLPDRPEGMPDLIPCTICVTFSGEQLQDVGVRLQPKIPQAQNWIAAGKTDSEGKAVLKTSGYYDGVVPGEYFVIFEKYAEPELDRYGMPMLAKPLIPIQYSKASGMITIVVTEDKDEYTFELEGLPAQ